jgi:DNA-binding MarR family transcriptional regulator
VPRPRRQSPFAAGSAGHIADRLHSAAIHLLRRVRAEDVATGLSGPQASALSVIVFRGPIAIGALAAAEQVRPPTISRLVRDLERKGLVERETHEGDARMQMLRATRQGTTLLAAGRARRVQRIAAEIEALPAADRSALRAAVEVLERLGKIAKTED